MISSTLMMLMRSRTGLGAWWVLAWVVIGRTLDLMLNRARTQIQLNMNWTHSWTQQPFALKKEDKYHQWRWWEQSALEANHQNFPMEAAGEMVQQLLLTQAESTSLVLDINSKRPSEETNEVARERSCRRMRCGWQTSWTSLRANVQPLARKGQMIWRHAFAWLLSGISMPQTPKLPSPCGDARMSRCTTSLSIWHIYEPQKGKTASVTQEEESRGRNTSVKTRLWKTNSKS